VALGNIARDCTSAALPRYSKAVDQLKVVIIGAGMGGLTAGLALRQAGYEIEIYDRVPALLPAGAGVSLWSNGVKVLDRLGLGREIASIGGRMERVCYRDRDGAKLTDFSLQPLVEAVGERAYPVTRTDLQRILLEALGTGVVRLGMECVAVEQDAETATAVFANGHRATGDVVVAADGTHSALRAAVVGRVLARRYVGYVNWNGLVAVGNGLPAADTWTTYVGEHKRAALMPVGGDQFYFFFDVPLPEGATADPGGARSELARHFAGWAEPVQTLIQRLDPGRTNRIAIHDVDPLSTLVNGRVALLGDSAHSMPPDLGQGGCLAMEDAWILAQLLLTTNLGVADALRRYDEARRPRTTEIVLRARKRSEMTHGSEPQKTLGWYRELAASDGGEILEGIVRTIRGGPV
jgi:FAD-dependent urate hydroxylase